MSRAADKGEPVEALKRRQVESRQYRYLAGKGLPVLLRLRLHLRVLPRRRAEYHRPYKNSAVDS